uniref:[Histone H3]-lysine(27) N-trimethyltransferase n=1 Tax=Heterorhabditis bacteriophora TaxID=37862 RepID=A0A1I7XAB2_HETBA
MAPVPEPGATPPGTTFKRPRGRPRKNAEAVAEQDPPMLADTSSPPPMSFNRPRGRPRKVVDVEIDTTGSTSSTRPVVAGPTRPSGQRSRGGRKRRVHSAPAKRTKEDEKHDKNGQETMEIDDEDDEEDEKYDEYLLKECTEKVMDHFRKVQEHYRKRIKEEAAPEFKRAISSLPIRSYHTYNNVQPVPLHLHEEDPEQFADTAKVSDRRNGSTQRCGVRWLPAVELRPRTAYWVHTEYNVKGIHGADTGCGEYINDYMMFHLLDSLKSEWEDKGPEVMEHFYYSIFKLFPNKLSHRQLVYARADLEERFAPDRMPSKSAQEMRSRKDNEFHSVSVLMCGKCHQYDCLLHVITLKLLGACEEEKMRMKRKPGLRVDSEEPCGPDCYMNDPRAQALRVAFDRESNGEIPTIPNLPGQTPTAPPLPYRNPSVMNIFRTLISSDKVNICEVARHMVMITQDIGHPIKSCKELFHLSITFPRSRRDVSPEMKKVSDRDKHRSFRSFTWADGKGQVDNSTRMVPCKHSGVCGPSTDCRCFQKNGICNKYCSCGPECKMKFPGCRCQPGYQISQRATFNITISPIISMIFFPIFRLEYRVLLGGVVSLMKKQKRSQLTRCTPESDSSRTSVNGSQSKEEELRKAVLKKATNGNIKSGASGTRGKGRKRKI